MAQQHQERIMAIAARVPIPSPFSLVLLLGTNFDSAKLVKVCYLPSRFRLELRKAWLES